ncbi:hypothetical protein CROQUDRAFT_137132, partial [Cronartium quercuum f. sp. fusiforme G11]
MALAIARSHGTEPTMTDQALLLNTTDNVGDQTMHLDLIILENVGENNENQLTQIEMVPSTPFHSGPALPSNCIKEPAKQPPHTENLNTERADQDEDENQADKGDEKKGKYKENCTSYQPDSLGFRNFQELLHNNPRNTEYVDSVTLRAILQKQLDFAAVQVAEEKMPDWMRAS